MILVAHIQDNLKSIEIFMVHGILMLLLLAVLVFVAGVFVLLIWSGLTSGNGDSRMNTLKDRLAKGEITVAEFDEISNKLRSQL